VEIIAGCDSPNCFTVERTVSPSMSAVQAAKEMTKKEKGPL
jgi:hypothetical protein